MSKYFSGFITALLLTTISASAQDTELEMSFEEYDPISTLVVPGGEVTNAKFPFVDVHSHLWRMATMDLERTVREMDSLNLQVLVNLSAQSGDQLLAMSEAVQRIAPNRFIIFANVDFRGMDDPNWTENAVAQLRQDYENGARGLKIFKNSLEFSLKFIFKRNKRFFYQLIISYLSYIHYLILILRNSLPFSLEILLE